MNMSAVTLVTKIHISRRYANWLTWTLGQLSTYLAKHAI